jgi:hypothetical protein
VLHFEILGLVQRIWENLSSKQASLPLRSFPQVPGRFWESQLSSEFQYTLSQIVTLFTQGVVQVLVDKKAGGTA